MATTSHKSALGTFLRRIQHDISVNHVVAARYLIPENFPGASRFLSVKGRLESPPPTVVVGTIMAGLALLSADVSNGTAGVTVLSR